jgi:murein DD-endopeptidase MepM/ murein hydrolase activator NlpD
VGTGFKADLMNRHKILAIFLCLFLCCLARSTSIAQTSQSTNEEVISQIQALRQQNDELIKGEQNAIEKIRNYGDFRLKNEYAKVVNMVAGLAKDAATGGVPGFIAGSLKEIGVGTLDLAADKLPPSLRDKAKAASAAISYASGDVVGVSLKTYEKLCDAMIDYYTSVHEVLIKQQHQNNLKIKELESNLTATEIKRGRAFPTSKEPGKETAVIKFPQFNYTQNQQANLSLQDQLRFAFREYEIKMREFHYNEYKKFEERRRKLHEEFNNEDIQLSEKLSKVGFGTIESTKIILKKNQLYNKYLGEVQQIDHEWRMFEDTYNLDFDKKRKMFEQKLSESINNSNPISNSTGQPYQLVKSPDNTTVYILKDGKKYAISKAGDFNRLGLDWNKIQTIPSNQLNSVPTGDPINKSNSQQILGRQMTDKVNPISQMNKGGFGWLQPTNNNLQPTNNNITYLGTGKNIHNGVDLKASPGTVVKAPETGLITKASYDAKKGQLTLQMKGESGYEYIFIHMADNPDLREKLKKGNVPIEAGIELGKVGDAKEDTWATYKGKPLPHLHVSVKKDGKYLDPNSLFTINK